MSTRMPKVRHDLEQRWQDLAAIGEAAFYSSCTCGWISRPSSSEGVAYGLYRRHLVLAGRGQPKRRSSQSGGR